MGDLVVVSGIPRSGTSWVAKALSFAPGWSYFREPDNDEQVAGAERYFRWLYLPSGAEDERFGRHMRRALTGRVATPSTLAEDVGPLLGRLPPKTAQKLGRRLPKLYFTRPNTLVKLVFCNLALEWISDEFPEARQVHLLRHPCGTFASWRRLGWNPRPHLLLADPRLVEDHLAPYVGVIHRADGFWERAGAEWAARTLVATRQLERHPHWTVVQHEWLCEDPSPRFEALAGRLGMAFPPRAKAFIADADRPGDEASYGLRRAARAEIDKWKRELSADDIAACRKVVEQFDLPWYPDFEPVPAPPAWS